MKNYSAAGVSGFGHVHELLPQVGHFVVSSIIINILIVKIAITDIRLY